MASVDVERASASQLVQAVAESKKYAFLLGAGTSRPKPASIPTANELVEKWREECYERDDPDEEFEEWIEAKEDAMKSDQSEYGFWFEERHPTRGQRRERIQRLVESAEPTPGHVLIASMMGEGYVPHALTPNFDDLLFDAFYLFLEGKPNLIDHRAVAPEFKLTREEPAIVKLHGDYLYDNLQNTDQETATLEPAMEDALQQTVTEYGLVVVGYGGNDDSIMSPLLDADLSEYGLYWCALHPDDLSPKVEQLLERPNTYLVEIEGFETLMTKFGRQIDDVEPPAPEELIERAERRGDKLEGVLEERREEASEDEEEFMDRTLKLWQASQAYEEGEYERALTLCDEAIELDPENAKAYNIRGSVKDELGKYAAAIEDYDKAIELDPENANAHNNRGVAKGNLNEYEGAIEDYDKAIELDPENAKAYHNRAEARIRIGEFERARKDAIESKSVANSTNERAVGLLLQLVSNVRLGEDIEAEEHEYRKLCEEEFTTTWSFEELDSWLETADIDSEKREKIAELMRLLREHKNDS